MWGEAGTEAIKPFANTLSLVMGVVAVRRGCHGASSRVLKEHRPVIGCAIEGVHAAWLENFFVGYQHCLCPWRVCYSTNRTLLALRIRRFASAADFSTLP